MARTNMPPEYEPVADDYVIEREDERPSLPIATQVIRVLRVLLVVIVAAASLALFWIVGTMVGIF